MQLFDCKFPSIKLICFRITILLFVSLFAFSSFAQERVISVGLLTDLSNDGAPVGIQSQAGARFAEEVLNSQGKKIKLIVGDHKVDTKIAISEAQKMVSIENVDALISDTTPTSFAISPIVAGVKKLMIYISPVASLTKTNPYAFRSFLDYEEGCRGLAQLFKNDGKKKLGMLKINFEFSEDCQRGIEQVYPNPEIVSYNKGEEMRLLNLKLKQRGVDAVIQMGYEADFINRAKAASELKFKIPIGIPSFWMTEKVKAEMIGSGIVCYGVGFTPVDKDFAKQLKSKKYYAGEINIEIAAMSYQNVMHLYSAISSCPKDDVLCQSNKLSEQRAVGVIGFEGWKDRLARYALRYQRWEKGKFSEISKH
jgi:ABC-type branched-subunit amino acid transport system substrate-binding protein